MAIKTHCGVCGALLVGRVALDGWDNYYCAQHEHEYPSCSACNRLVCGPLTGGDGEKYSDFRISCNLCRQTAIDTREQAKPAFEGVARFFSNLGLIFKGLNLRINLGDSLEYKKLRFGDLTSLTGPGRGQIMGIINKTMLVQGIQSRRVVDGISILHGLPRSLFMGIAAHELGHAWLYLARVDGLPDWMEEGFCNLLTYLYYKNNSVPEGPFWIKMLENDPSPVYGDGFRKVRAAFRKGGFKESMRYLYEHKALPPFGSPTGARSAGDEALPPFGGDEALPH